MSKGLSSDELYLTVAIVRLFAIGLVACTGIFFVMRSIG